MPSGLIVGLALMAIVIVSEPIRCFLVRGIKQQRWQMAKKEILSWLSDIAWLSFEFAVSVVYVFVAVVLFAYLSSWQVVPIWLEATLAVCLAITYIGLLLIIRRITIWKPEYTPEEKAILHQERLDFQREHPRISNAMMRIKALARKMPT